MIYALWLAVAPVNADLIYMLRQDEEVRISICQTIAPLREELDIWEKGLECGKKEPRIYDGWTGEKYKLYRGK